MAFVPSISIPIVVIMHLSMTPCSLRTNYISLYRPLDATVISKQRGFPSTGLISSGVSPTGAPKSFPFSSLKRTVNVWP